jgi:hypothetical protein
VIPPVSTTDELREYWKVANGWKAAASEGRKYCMKLSPEKDTPIYTLSSTTQGFYHLRVNPTSASAYVTLSRHDPSKPFKERDPNADARPAGILATLRDPEGKNNPWAEVINTTIEEESRRLPPEDGLVALLYPCAATKMALDKPGDIQAVMMAERECARLVWDEDSQNYFLAHPALATPFCITIERTPAWSRTEYTLEHIESPQHLAKLTRDGTGDGWMELDTMIAGRIDSFYILDVAVCALIVVANLDEKNMGGAVEQFEPPPSELPLPVPAHLRDSFGSSNHQRAGSLLGGITGRKAESSSKKKRSSSEKKKKKPSRLEEFELGDLESQASSLGKQIDMKVGKDKLPMPVRMIVWLITAFFKVLMWCIKIVFVIVGKFLRWLTK